MTNLTSYPAIMGIIGAVTVTAAMVTGRLDRRGRRAEARRQP